MENLVSTTTGLVRGYGFGDHIAYLGIPYAEPPVGELRFRRAVAKRPWEGVFDAGQYGERAVQWQNGGAVGSEDCLTVNVRTPLEGKDLPVLVYIHGGGHNTGAASDFLFDGACFIREGIVFVTFQYRLNVLGFYDFSTYPEGAGLDRGCGISDTILALRWIHDNIASFGGDPENITIAGESAGASSVLAMMAAPEAKGLFRRGIAASPVVNAQTDGEAARKNMDLYLEGMGFTPADIPKLKELPAFDLLKGNEYMAAQVQSRHPGFFTPSIPQDDLIPRRLTDALAAGAAEGIDLMIGTNRNDAVMLTRKEQSFLPNSWECVEALLRRHGLERRFPALREYYEARFPGELEGIPWSLIQFNTDYTFQVPVMALAQAQGSHAKVYHYRFQLDSPGAVCDHAMDLPLEFEKMDNPYADWCFRGVSLEARQALQQEVHGAWVRFVKTGVPHKDWPPYQSQQSPMRIWSETPETRVLDRTELEKLWDGLEFYR